MELEQKSYGVQETVSYDNFFSLKSKFIGRPFEGAVDCVYAPGVDWDALAKGDPIALAQAQKQAGERMDTIRTFLFLSLSKKELEKLQSHRFTKEK